MNLLSIFPSWAEVCWNCSCLRSEGPSLLRSQASCFPLPFEVTVCLGVQLGYKLGGDVYGRPRKPMFLDVSDSLAICVYIYTHVFFATNIIY